MRCIDEAGTCRHADGISGRPIICQVLGRAVEIKRGAVIPSGNDAFANIVFVDLWRDSRLRDFGKHETIALLHIENGVVAENKRNALVFARCFVVFLRVFGKLLVLVFEGRQRAGAIWWLEWDLNPHGIAPNGF